MSDNNLYFPLLMCKKIFFLFSKSLTFTHEYLFVSRADSILLYLKNEDDGTTRPIERHRL